MSFYNYKPATNMNAKIGQKVRITKSELSYAQGQEGHVTGLKEGGYTVKITTMVPVSGVIPTSEERNVEVWADEVEVIL